MSVIALELPSSPQLDLVVHARVLRAALANREAHAVLLPAAAVGGFPLHVHVAREGGPRFDGQLRDQDRAPLLVRNLRRQLPREGRDLVGVHEEQRAIRGGEAAARVEALPGEADGAAQNREGEDTSA
jgi:hypothetical protein